MRHNAVIRPSRAPIAVGFILECTFATMRGTSCPVEWHFPDIEAARDFCTACDLSWTLVVEPIGPVMGSISVRRDSDEPST